MEVKTANVKIKAARKTNTSDDVSPVNYFFMEDSCSVIGVEI